MDNEPFDEMTDEQFERQDFVDNTVFSLIQEVNPINKLLIGISK